MRHDHRSCEVLWHDTIRPAARTITLLDEGNACWDKLMLTCEYTQARLTDPASGESCLHLPCCNYDALVSYVRTHRCCPVFGCAVSKMRSSSVQRDETLREKLAALPESAEHCFIHSGTGEVRLHLPPPPSQPSAGAASSSNGAPMIVIEDDDSEGEVVDAVEVVDVEDEEEVGVEDDVGGG